MGGRGGCRGAMMMGDGWRRRREAGVYAGCCPRGIDGGVSTIVPQMLCSLLFLRCDFDLEEAVRKVDGALRAPCLLVGYFLSGILCEVS